MILQGLYIEVESVAKKSKQLIGMARARLMGGCFHAGRVACPLRHQRPRVHLSLAPVSHRALMLQESDGRILRRNPACIDFELGCVRDTDI